MCSNCKEKQKYYITTAIAYTSGKPHIGNTYEFVRMRSQDTKEAEDMTSISRREPMNMVRKSS